ncbi:unnamed protein product [Didymodactylos carnosus]|uniref:Uncharacterized protein n=2 Tax=Didymodactylos carnosus TaxID=1234261 RepID=A0A816DPB3_9BILA|nr:unnamed protein product [Didymodactylos carnosus]CAF4543047.1 unnamed protein product [Didymodactylos carnosus]
MESAEDIDDYFNKIDNAIGSNTSDDQISSLFSNALRIIDDVLQYEDDDLKFNQAKHQYHTKKSSYLRSIGKLDDAQKEERVAARHGKKLQQQTPAPQPLPPGSTERHEDDDYATKISTTTATTSPQAVNATFADVKTTVQKCFAELQSCLSRLSMQPMINELRPLVENYFVDYVKTFEQYTSLDMISSQIRFTLNLLRDQAITAKSSSTTSSSAATSTTGITQEVTAATTGNTLPFRSDESKLPVFIAKLDISIVECLYEYRRTFCQFLLSQEQYISKILFENVPLTVS